MDLDNTEIVIRERTLSQRIDLSFHLIQRFASEILMYAAIGILPFFLLNIAVVELFDSTGYWEYYFWFGKWTLIFVLTLIEAPFALAPLLIFLSQRIFRQKVQLGLTLAKALKGYLRLFWVYGVVRLNIFLFPLILLFYRSENSEGLMTMSIVTVIWNYLCFAIRPNVDPIIFLEELKIRSGQDEPKLRERSAALHRFQSGDLFGEGLALLSLSFVLFCGIYAIQLWCIYLLWQNTVTLNWFSWTFFALALWAVQVFAIVFRFLGYLDIRVRLEGWELELRMKAEGNKILKKLEHDLHLPGVGTTDQRDRSVSTARRLPKGGVH